MGMIENPAGHKRLARAIGAGMLLALALAAFEASALGGDALSAAALDGFDAFAAALTVAMVSDAAEAALTILLAVGFFVLLRPVSPALALVAGLCRLAAAGFAGAGLFVAYRVLADVSGRSDDGNASARLADAAQRLQDFNFDFFHWGLIASSIGAAIGFALLFAGRLIPRALAGYGVLASIGAVVGAASIYLAPTLSDLMFPAYVAANALAYVSLTLWLIVFGVSANAWNARFADR